MANSSSGTLVKLPRRMRFSEMSRKKRSTMLSHAALGGGSCMKRRGCLASQAKRVASTSRAYVQVRAGCRAAPGSCRRGALTSAGRGEHQQFQGAAERSSAFAALARMLCCWLHRGYMSPKTVRGPAQRQPQALHLDRQRDRHPGQGHASQGGIGTEHKISTYLNGALH